MSRLIPTFISTLLENTMFVFKVTITYADGTVNQHFTVSNSYAAAYNLAMDSVTATHCTVEHVVQTNDSWDVN